MAVEVIFLVPVLMMFIMLVVAGGRYVSAEGDVQAAARDAARAAALQDDEAAARSAAEATYRASVDDPGACSLGVNTAAWGPDGTVTVSVSCPVTFSDLGLLGLPGSVRVEADSEVRLDPYRRLE